MFSLAKDENVVKPPQNPALRNNRNSAFIRFPRSDKPYKIPIRRLPRMFTVKVPYEKTETKEFCTKRDVS